MIQSKPIYEEGDTLKSPMSTKVIAFIVRSLSTTTTTTAAAKTQGIDGFTGEVY